MRRLTQEAAGGAATSASKLSPACDALVRLAEPGDVYAHYNRAMSAAAVSTQIKAIEQRLGLKVGKTVFIDEVLSCTGDIGAVCGCCVGRVRRFDSGNISGSNIKSERPVGKGLRKGFA